MTTRKVPAIKAAFGSLLIAVLMLGMAFTPFSASAATVVDSDTVRVERGDTLTGIARDFLGNASLFDEIAELNDIEDPDVIRVGQLINLPEEIDEDTDDDEDTDTTDGTTTSTTTIRVDSDDDDENDLTDLFILSELFRDDGGTTTDGGNRDWFDLIILDEVLGDDNGDGILGGDSDLLGDDNELVDLFILEELFSGDGSSSFGGDGERDFFDLIILDEVLGDDNGGILDDDNGNDLVDLFILDELFNNGDGSFMRSETESQSNTNTNTQNQ